MATPHRRFPPRIQRLALARQKSRCASCGFAIRAPGYAGQADHDFGEWAEAHHVIPNLMQGPATLENCVIVCRACHLNAHQGGLWKDLTIYGDLTRLTMPQKIAKIAEEYPHYRG